jgi:hypothetical protein
MKNPYPRKPAKKPNQMTSFGVHELNNQHKVIKAGLKDIWTKAPKSKSSRELVMGVKPQPNRRARGGG